MRLSYECHQLSGLSSAIQMKILAQVLVIPLSLNHRSDVSVRLKKVGFDARFNFKVFGANALSC